MHLSLHHQVIFEVINFQLLAASNQHKSYHLLLKFLSFSYFLILIPKFLFRVFSIILRVHLNTIIIDSFIIIGVQGLWLSVSLNLLHLLNSFLIPISIFWHNHLPIYLFPLIKPYFRDFHSHFRVLLFHLSIYYSHPAIF